MNDWYRTTCIADTVDTEYSAKLGRYRWRLRPLRTLRVSRFDAIIEEMYNEEPWSQRPIPDKIKPHWMK